jgi:tRNA A22 N-methylase
MYLIKEIISETKELLKIVKDFLAQPNPAN